VPYVPPLFRERAAQSYSAWAFRGMGPRPEVVTPRRQGSRAVGDLDAFIACPGNTCPNPTLAKWKKTRGTTRAQ